MGESTSCTMALSTRALLLAIIVVPTTGLSNISGFVKIDQKNDEARGNMIMFKFHW